MKGNAMNNRITYSILAVFLIIFWSGLIWLSFQLATPEKRIDCSVAEFHPDYTADMKAKCREQRRIKT
jgi:hypothetical protein